MLVMFLPIFVVDSKTIYRYFAAPLIFWEDLLHWKQEILLISGYVKCARMRGFF